MSLLDLNVIGIEFGGAFVGICRFRVFLRVGIRFIQGLKGTVGIGPLLHKNFEKVDCFLVIAGIHLQLRERSNAFFRAGFDSKELLVNLGCLVSIAFDLIQAAQHQKRLTFGGIDADDFFKLMDSAVDRFHTGRLLRVCSTDDLQVDRRQKLMTFDVVRICLNSLLRRVHRFPQPIVSQVTLGHLRKDQ